MAQKAPLVKKGPSKKRSSYETFLNAQEVPSQPVKTISPGQEHGVILVHDSPRSRNEEKAISFENHFNEKLNLKIMNVPPMENGNSCCLGAGWWRNPSEDALPVSYCKNNTMHGLKYVVEPNRHLSERICWLVTFMIGVAAAAYMINTVWENYRTNPVIVTFQPTETDIKDIPFPAITICNMNLFSRSLVEKLQSTSEDQSIDHEARLRARTDLQFIRSICQTTKSFSQIFDFAFHRGRIETDSRVGEDFLNKTDSAYDLISLLVDYTTPCHELIRLCVWAEEKRNCGEFFNPIITEYGKCCTFNILPASLLLSSTTQTLFNNSGGIVNKKTGKVLKPRWNESEVEKWRQWDYTNDGFQLQEDQERPFRQSRAGIPFGLSLLIDANTDEYFCPLSDSLGFRLVLHTALEMPPVQNWGVAIPLNKEIFLEVTPDLTLSDPRVANFPYEKRKCFFQSEKVLEFYSAYTTSNCLNECIANTTAEKCGCALFYMPRRVTTRICSSMEDSEDYECSQRARANLTKNYKNACKICDSLCTDIFYSFELSQAELQNSRDLWGDPKNLSDMPPWANNKVNSLSILHIYFAFDSFVPRLRNELYNTVDLIANTGGLLGLCLGFSALSAVEALYFFTVRFFFLRVRRNMISRYLSQKIVNVVRSTGWGGWKERFESDNDSATSIFSQSHPPLDSMGMNGQYRSSKVKKMESKNNILPVCPPYNNFSDKKSHNGRNNNNNNLFRASLGFSNSDRNSQSNSFLV